MARFFLPRHGRTHCPGGSDPIPCVQTVEWYSGQTIDHTFTTGAGQTWNVDAYTIALQGENQTFISEDANGKPQILGQGVYEELVVLQIHGTFPTFAQMNVMHTKDGASFGTSYTGADNINLAGGIAQAWPAAGPSSVLVAAKQVLVIPFDEPDASFPVTVDAQAVQLFTSGTRVGNVATSVYRLGAAPSAYV